jgi:hypothetical protein
MYIRFITQFNDACNEEDTGVFQAANYLRKSDFIYEYDRQNLERVWIWFNTHLDAQTRFHLSKNKYAEHISLSWFKVTSIRHIRKMYEMVDILEQYGFVVNKVRRKRPGIIVYEDDYQVSSIPFRPDKKLVK